MNDVDRILIWATAMFAASAVLAVAMSRRPKRRHW